LTVTELGENWKSLIVTPVEAAAIATGLGFCFPVGASSRRTCGSAAGAAGSGAAGAGAAGAGAGSAGAAGSAVGARLPRGRRRGRRGRELRLLLSRQGRSDRQRGDHGVKPDKSSHTPHAAISLPIRSQAAKGSK
jgi:hypothetical protein